MNPLLSKAGELLLGSLNGFAKFFYPQIMHGIKEVINDGKVLRWRNIIIDITDVASSLGMFLVLNILALLIFIVMPAGRDVLLVMVEDLSNVNNISTMFGNLIFLIIGVVSWSVFSEFAARYAIYVSDNSAFSLDDKRVKFRKTIQKAFAAFFLLLPYLIVITSLIINYAGSNDEDRRSDRLGYIVAIVVFYMLLNKISHLYFEHALKDRMREKRESNWFNRLVILPVTEKLWAEKLYGIYNFHVYSFPKPSNFKDDRANEYFPDDGEATLDPKSPRGRLSEFVKAVIDTGNASELLSFPQDDKKLIKEKRVPQQFRLIGFSKEEGKPEGNYFWKYRVPLSFYRTLHRQIRVIFFICIIAFISIALLPVSAYENIGAPGLIFISFGCTCGLYVGTIYMDYTNNFFKIIPLRLLLIILFLVSSRFNNDHPIRTDNCNCSETIHTREKNGKYVTTSERNNRLSLNEHFNKWSEQFMKDTLNRFYFNLGDSSFKKDTCYPALFICAEGGALRTGAFTAYTLSVIKDSLFLSDKIDINKSIYAMSGVSGGSLGLGFYNAYNYLTPSEDMDKPNSVKEAAKDFFNNDFLSPLIGKMFFGEYIQLFLPFHIERFDRAIALEVAWENGFGKLVKPAARNTFGTDLSCLTNKTDTATPALFVNTSEVETGLQCWLSNVEPKGLMFGGERDLLKNKIQQDIKYSTMVNFSSRFPGFSPAATVEKDPIHKYHYVDGGYVENTGAATMLEVLQSLTPQMKAKHIKPFVLVFRYHKDEEGYDNLNWFNELSEILMGIYNTRAGRTKTALEQLKNYTRDNFNIETCVVPLDAQTKSSPQNWVLSHGNFKHITFCGDSLWANRKRNSLSCLYFNDLRYSQK